MRAYLTSSQGRQITIKYAGPGDIFGLPTLTGGPVPVSVQVLRASFGLILNPQSLEPLGISEPAVGWRLAEEIGADFCDLLFILSENLFDSTPTRTAQHLLQPAVIQPPDGQLTVLQSQ